MENNTKLLVVYSAAGACISELIRNHLETNSDRFRLIKLCTNNEKYLKWQNNSNCPMKYIPTEKLVNLRESGELYWWEEQSSGIDRSILAILKEDINKAFEDQERVTYLELPIDKAIKIKKIFPQDVFLLCSNEWLEYYDEKKDPITQVMRRESDCFIDNFNVNISKLLEEISKVVIGK